MMVWHVQLCGCQGMITYNSCVKRMICTKTGYVRSHSTTCGLTRENLWVCTECISNRILLLLYLTALYSICDDCGTWISQLVCSSLIFRPFLAPVLANATFLMWSHCRSSLTPTPSSAPGDCSFQLVLHTARECKVWGFVGSCLTTNPLSLNNTKWNGWRW